MANPQSTPEDLEAAYTLLLLSQDPVHFSAPTTLATFTGVEHESSNHSSKQVRMTRRGNKGPTASTRARSNQSDKTLTKGKNSHCGKEKAMKLTERAKFNAWHQPLSRPDLENQDVLKIRRVRWTKPEVNALKNKALLLKRPGTMSEQRRASLAAIFPNRSVGALHSIICKIKVAESKAARKLEGVGGGKENSELM